VATLPRWFKHLLVSGYAGFRHKEVTHD
jgi:hypothetical protein